MERLAEWEFDALNTQEAAVADPGLAKEQKSKEKHIFIGHTWEAHFDISLGDWYNLLHLKGTWKHIQVLSKLVLLMKHVDDNHSVYILWNTFLSFTSAIFNWCAARIFKTCNTWLFGQGHWPLSLRLANKKTTTANTTVAFWCRGIKMIPIFCQISKKYIFGMLQNFNNYFVRHEMKKVGNRVFLLWTTHH